MFELEMASDRQTDLVIKVSPNELRTLPDLNGRLPLIQQFKHIASTEHNGQYDDQKIRWTCHPEKLLPAPEPQELSKSLLSYGPDHVYVILSPKPLKDLSPSEIRPLLEVEDAVSDFRNSAALNSTEDNSRSILLTDVSRKVTLLFDGDLDLYSIGEYEALFCAHETLSGPAAASIMFSRLENLTLSNTQWSGSVQLSRDAQHQPTDVVEFPGFHLYATNPSTVPVPVHATSYARILAVAKKMPSIACMFTATLGFQLHLAQSCSQRSASFFNAMVSSGKSVLLGIGDAMFWCFWISKRNDAIGQFAALYISPMPVSAAPALDVAKWRSKLQLGADLLVRQLPSEITSLPVRSLFDSSSNPCSPENVNHNSDLIIKDGISLLSKYAARSSTSLRLNCKSHSNTTDDDILNNEISGAELQTLLRRQKEKEQTQALCSGILTSTLTKSDSCSVMESRSLTGKKSSTSREVQLAFRQRRFQRLMQSQREKRVVESASTISSLGQRGKRVRSTDIDSGRRHFVKKSRQTSSSIYIGHAIRNSLDALGKCPSFQVTNEDDNRAPETSNDLAKSLSESHKEWSQLPSDWEKRARYNQGRHGVEYQFDNDNRDIHIVKYESLVAKTSMEFETRSLQPHECSKLNAAIKKIRSLQNKKLPMKHPNKLPGLVNCCSGLLHDLLDGLHRGEVVITDSRLRERLLQFSVKSDR